MSHDKNSSRVLFDASNPVAGRDNYKGLLLIDRLMHNQLFVDNATRGSDWALYRDIDAKVFEAIAAVHAQFEESLKDLGAAVVGMMDALPGVKADTRIGACPETTQGLVLTKAIDYVRAAEEAVVAGDPDPSGVAFDAGAERRMQAEFDRLVETGALKKMSLYAAVRRLSLIGLHGSASEEGLKHLENAVKELSRCVAATDKGHFRNPGLRDLVQRTIEAVEDATEPDPAIVPHIDRKSRVDIMKRDPARATGGGAGAGAVAADYRETARRADAHGHVSEAGSAADSSPKPDGR